MAWKLIAGVVVLVVVFLLGYVPQKREAKRGQEEIAGLRQQLVEKERALELAELRDLATLVHVEAARKNYQRASEHSTAFFDRLARALKTSEDASQRQAFQSLLSARDSVTAKLAQGDAGVTAEIQDLLLRLQEATAPATLGN